MGSPGLAGLSARIAEIESMASALTPTVARPAASSGAGFARMLDAVGGPTAPGGRVGSTGTSGTVGDQVVELALSKLGTPYVYGAGRGENPTNFDCSGLTYWAYGQAGVKIGTWTGTQQHDGVRVADYHARGGPLSRADVMAAAQPGDLILMKGGDGSYQSGYPGHVGIYIGNGQMVHAPKTGDVVKVEDLAQRSDVMYIQRIVPTGSPSTAPGAPASGDLAAVSARLDALLARVTGPAASGAGSVRSLMSSSPGGSW